MCQGGMNLNLLCSQRVLARDKVLAEGVMGNRGCNYWHGERFWWGFLLRVCLLINTHMHVNVVVIFVRAVPRSYFVTHLYRATLAAI